jgi:3-oxoacyl-[acyl-carrier-protein] synthase-1
MTARCALGDDLDAIAEALREGRSGLRPLGEVFGDAVPVAGWYGALATPPGGWALLPEAWSGFDTRQARVAAAVVADLAGPIGNAIARWGADRVGVAIGSTTGGIGDTEQRHAAWRASGAWPDGYDLARQHNLHATAEVVAALTGARGPAIVQSSACASSAKVLGTARRWIALGVCDAVVCGGIDTACRFTLMGFSGLGILSPERCQPMGVERQGINLGEAAALMLVEREASDDAPARVWLSGVGETSDAFHLTQPRPDGAGLAAAVEAALREAGLPAEAVGFVNAHATGTPANDPAELAAIEAALPHRPPICATKGHTGHTLGAAGALEAVLTALSLERGFLPGVTTVGEVLSGAVVRAATPTSARAAMSLSAAFAGHNAAVLLEAG